MQVEGTINGSIKSVVLDISGSLTAFTIYNKTNAAVVCSVGIVTESLTDRYMFNFNLAAVGTANSSVYQETKITVKSGSSILLVTSGEVEYLFQID